MIKYDVLETILFERHLRELSAPMIVLNFPSGDESGHPNYTFDDAVRLATERARADVQEIQKEVAKMPAALRQGFER